MGGSSTAQRELFLSNNVLVICFQPTSSLASYSDLDKFIPDFAISQILNVQSSDELNSKPIPRCRILSNNLPITPLNPSSQNHFTPPPSLRRLENSQIDIRGGLFGKDSARSHPPSPLGG